MRSKIIEFLRAFVKLIISNTYYLLLTWLLVLVTITEHIVRLIKGPCDDGEAKEGDGWNETT